MVKKHDLELMTLICRSSFSQTAVYLTRKKNTGNSKNNLKVVRLTSLEETSAVNLEILSKELAMCRTLSHEHILTHHSSFVVSSQLFVTMELMKYGSCTDIIGTHFQNGLPEPVIAFLLIWEGGILRGQFSLTNGYRYASGLCKCT